VSLLLDAVTFGCRYVWVSLLFDIVTLYAVNFGVVTFGCRYF
jgi:hypothetical protein